MIIGSNELFPTSVLEKVYLVLLMIIGNLVIANIVGEMAVLTQIISRRSKAFQDKLDIANAIMQKIKVTDDCRLEIRDYFFLTRKNLEE